MIILRQKLSETAVQVGIEIATLCKFPDHNVVYSTRVIFGFAISFETVEYEFAVVVLGSKSYL